MFRRLSPFVFNGLLLASCFTQGLPGDNAGGGGGQTPPAGGAGAGNGAGAASGSAAVPGVGPEGRMANGQFEPDWFNGRIKQAKENAERELLERLGVPDAAAAAKLLDEGKKAADAQKTELQRKDDKIKELEPHKAQAETYRNALSTRAETELKTLPEAAQVSIKALLGDSPDPIKVLAAVDMARAMAPAAAAGAGQGQGANAGGQQGQGQPGQAASGQGKPPAQPAANTTGALGGPPSANGSPPDHLATWTDMQSKNPFAAAQYFLQNQQAIVQAQQAKNK